MRRDRDGAGRGGRRARREPRRSARHRGRERRIGGARTVPVARRRGVALLLRTEHRRHRVDVQVRGARHARARWIAGRDLDRGFVCTRGVDGRLHVDEGCSRHDGARRRVGARRVRHPRQRDPAGLRAHRGHRRSLHRRAVGRSARTQRPQAQRNPRRHRGARRAPRAAGRRVDHRPGDRRRRGNGRATDGRSQRSLPSDLRRRRGRRRARRRTAADRL